LGGRPERTKSKVEFSAQGKRDFDKIRKRINKTVESDLYGTLESISEDPLSGKPLRDNLHGLRSIKFGGNYRIIYEITRENKATVIIIHAIGDRKEIYERISRHLSILY
jgi:addiction module RelE/StbE family toxin